LTDVRQQPGYSLSPNPAIALALVSLRSEILAYQSPRKTQSLDSAPLAYLHNGVARDFQAAKAHIRSSSPPSAPGLDLELCRNPITVTRDASILAAQPNIDAETTTFFYAQFRPSFRLGMVVSM